MSLEYTNAIEKRAAWLRWAKGTGGKVWGELGFDKAMPGYIDVLESADTFYMNSVFCSLVDHARQDVPGNLAYDATWLQSPSGFLWLETPFEVPQLQEVVERGVPEQLIPLFVRAIGWRPIPAGTPLNNRLDGNKIAPAGYTQFLTFQDFDLFKPGTPGFGCWSYFGMRGGERVQDRINEFERLCEVDHHGEYTQDSSENRNKLHEIRWIYSALHLMSQRFAMTVEHKPDRAARRRGEREGRKTPPWIRVITLRRMEEARKRDGHKDVNWRWSWSVRGHWRNQWYPSKGIHAPCFIESYCKGPAHLPLKDGSTKLFAAVR